MGPDRGRIPQTRRARQRKADIKNLLKVQRPSPNGQPAFYRRYENAFLALAAMLAFLILWELLPASGLANPFFTSSPSRILRAAGWLFAHGFWNDLLVSLKEFAAGMGLAIAFSIPLGLLLGWYRRL